MHIQVKWNNSQYPTFNVEVCSEEGRDPFITIRDCRMIDGQKGKFVSYPAKKLDSGKYWNHVMGSDKFNAAVLKLAEASAPAQKPKKQEAVESDDIPF